MGSGLANSITVRKHGRMGLDLSRQSTQSSVHAPRHAHPGYIRPAVGFVIATFYCYGFFVSSVSWLQPVVETAVHAPRSWLLGGVRALLDHDVFRAREWSEGLYLAIVGIVLPWTVMALLGRGRPGNLGVRLPNRIGLRVLGVAYLASLPFLFWMVHGSGLGQYYLPHLRRSGAAAFLSYYAVNMTGEHFLLHGVILAVLRPGMRWPHPPPLPPVRAKGLSLLSRALRWIGLGMPTTTGIAAGNNEAAIEEIGAKPTSEQAAREGTTAVLQSSLPDHGTVGRGEVIRSWIGLPRSCVFAVLGSACLFALVHVGKNPHELILSVPGGVILAYLAYRTNSFLTPFVLHIATAGTALGMMILLE